MHAGCLAPSASAGPLPRTPHDLCAPSSRQHGSPSSARSGSTRRAQDLLGLEELPGISEHPTDRGPVVVVHGKKQHSGRDPAREALRFVRDLDIAEANALVLYGYGSGYVARALRKKSDARLFIFEPNLAALRAGLNHGPLPENVFFLTSVVAVKTVMYAALGTGDRGQLIPWQPTVRQSSELYQLVRAELEMAVHRAKIRALTAEIRGDGWFDFFLKNTPNILKGPMLGSMHGAFEGVPAVICSAGPSLNKQLEQLKEIQGQVVILCVNTAIGALIAPASPHAGGGGVREPRACSEDRLPPSSTPSSTSPGTRGTSSCPSGGGHLQHREHHLRLSSTSSTYGALSGGFVSPTPPSPSPTRWAATSSCSSGRIWPTPAERSTPRGRSLRPPLRDQGRQVHRPGRRLQISNFQEFKDALTATSSGDMTSERVVTTGRGGEEVESTNDFLMFRDWFSRTAVQLRELGIDCVNCTEGGLTIPEWAVPFREAIGRYVTPRTSSETPIRQRFDDLMDQDGPETGQVIDLRSAKPRTSSSSGA